MTAAMLFLGALQTVSAAPPLANAGPDIVIADYDGNASVTVKLDASASTDADGDIASWAWSWPGGSASGQKAEGVFPANNGTVTVTLTVTDALGGTSVDSLQLSAYLKATALFTDFAKTTYRDTGGGLEGLPAGDTLVIDYGGVDVFRRSGGAWAQTAFPTSASRHVPVDANTIVSGEFFTPTAMTATRFTGGQWVASPITVTGAFPGGTAFANSRQFAFTPTTVLVSDYLNDTHAQDAGQTFIYNWSGNAWTFATALTPPGGLVAGENFGRYIAVEGNLIVVSSLNAARTGNEFHIYRRSGSTWSLEATLSGASAGRPDAVFNWGFALGDGVIVAQTYRPGIGDYRLVTYERISSAWVEKEIAPAGVGASFFDSFVMDNDGESFAVSSPLGDHYLFRKNSAAATWSTATITSQRLLTGDLVSGATLRVSGFSNGLLTLRDGTRGIVRVIDTRTSVFPINVEPVANAGPDITTTSYDGLPVRVFLNGGGTSDIDTGETLTAVWTWNGGSASGLQAFASIAPNVDTATLTVTDSKGGISRDTINLFIDSPPVIDPGPDVVVVDSDGNGSIRLNVDGKVISQDHPVASWNWRWPGGTFTGQTGTLTIGQPADGEFVTLEVIDENGLSSRKQFAFRLLDPSPAPFILQPADGRDGDSFGWAVGIEKGTALVGAINTQTAGVLTGASYLSENINNVWQQLSLAPGTQQGSAVIVDEDYLFVGAFRKSGDGNPGTGRVIVYEKQAGSWVPTATLAPDSSAGFNFGLTIARSGDYLLVGAQGSTFTANSQGAAYLFQRIGGTWTFVQRLLSPIPETDGRFGAAVAIRGDVLVVGSQTFNGVLNSGIAHVFERGPSQWTATGTLKGAAGLAGVPSLDGYGQAVALNGSEILVAAREDITHTSGAVYRYVKTGGTWQANGKLFLGTGAVPSVTQYGSSLVLKDNILVVGVLGDGRNAARGSTYTYVYRNGGWQENGYLPISAAIDPALVNFTQFASSLDHDGKDLIVGAYQARTAAGVQSGKAYIYRNYAALNPTANYEPVANAGADVSVNDTIVRNPTTFAITEPLGSENVFLNGSASTDRENVIVSYAWSWNGGSATGVTASARFPVGTTVVTLTVTDDKGIVNTDTVNVTVTLPQFPPLAFPNTTGNSLKVNLPVPAAKWRLSSEFLWHDSGATVQNVVFGETYQIEIIAWPGSAETVTTFTTISSAAMVADLSLVLPVRATETGILRFPETSQDFSWRLTGESAWRNVANNNDAIEDLIDFSLPIGDYRIEFKPVAGFATPAPRVITVRENLILGLNWGDYIRIGNFDPAKTFGLAPSANLTGAPYQYVGMIRTPLGRGTGTVVSERVVLTAAHLLFDFTGLRWADTQWFSRQQQGERQAPPVAPRGVLFRTGYSKLVAPDSVEGTVANLPEDDQEVDFAVLYFSADTEWKQGSANYLQSSAARNWLTGSENKHAIGYPQRSQAYEIRGKVFEKTFATPLAPLDGNAPPKLYETAEVFGDGGASGSALFVRPQGATGFYPAAILLAGQGRAVYRVIDEEVGRMIKDGQDAASGNDEVLDSNSSLVTFSTLGSFTTVAVNIATPEVLPSARWTLTPNAGSGYSNIEPARQVPFNEAWDSFTVTFTAVSGYATPEPVLLRNNQITRSAVNTLGVRYDRLSAYDFWKQDRRIGPDSDDRDGDGKNALIEFATDGNPDKGADLPPIRTVVNRSQSVFAEYEVYVSSSARGIRYAVKASNTLPVANPVTLATFTAADGASAYIKVMDTQPLGSTGKRFAWVELVHDRTLPSGP